MHGKKNKNRKRTVTFYIKRGKGVLGYDKSQRRNVTFRLDRNLNDRVDKISVIIGVSKSDIFNAAVASFLSCRQFSKIEKEQKEDKTCEE